MGSSPIFRIFYLRNLHLETDAGFFYRIKGFVEIMLCSIGSDYTRKYLERDGKSMELKERISRVMKQSIHDCEVMGVNLLVEKDGRELLYCEEGLADRENHKPIRRDTIFRLYSQTKPVTAACAMILMERGLLNLGTSVSEYLPAYANMQVEKMEKSFRQRFRSEFTIFYV